MRIWKKRTYKFRLLLLLFLPHSNRSRIKRVTSVGCIFCSMCIVQTSSTYAILFCFILSAYHTRTRTRGFQHVYMKRFNKSVNHRLQFVLNLVLKLEHFLSKLKLFLYYFINCFWWWTKQAMSNFYPPSVYISFTKLYNWKITQILHK